VVLVVVEEEEKESKGYVVALRNVAMEHWVGTRRSEVVLG
jgi:hypothetical protein